MIWGPNSRWHTTSTPNAREQRKERDRKIGRGREQRYLLWDTDYLCDKEGALRKFQPTISLLKEDEPMKTITGMPTWIRTNLTMMHPYKKYYKLSMASERGISELSPWTLQESGP